MQIRHLKFLLSQSPIKEYVSFNLNSFEGILNKKFLTYAQLQEIFYKKPKEKAFREQLEKFWPQIKEKLVEKLKTTKSIQGDTLIIVLVTPDGKRTVYSEELQKFLSEKISEI